MWSNQLIVTFPDLVVTIKILINTPETEALEYQDLTIIDTLWLFSSDY